MFKTLLFLTLFSLCLYATVSEGHHNGAWATCSSECEKVSSCNGKCIRFSFHEHGVYDANHYKNDIDQEECWAITSCHGFPKFYAFHTNDRCSENCEVEETTAKQWERKVDSGTYHTNNMVCLEKVHHHSQFPSEMCFEASHILMGFISLLIAMMIL